MAPILQLLIVLVIILTDAHVRLVGQQIALASRQSSASASQVSSS